MIKKASRINAIKKTMEVSKELDNQEADLIMRTVNELNELPEYETKYTGKYGSANSHKYVQHNKRINVDDVRALIDEHSQDDEDDKSSHEDKSESSNEDDKSESSIDETEYKEDDKSESSSDDDDKSSKQTIKKSKPKSKPKGKERRVFRYFNGKIIPNDKGFRRFVYVWNNYPEDWRERLENFQADFLIGGAETAPETGTPHIQGYCEFRQQYRIGKFADRMYERVAVDNNPSKCPVFEPAYDKSTAYDNIEYITKQDKNALQYGEIGKQGKRTDIRKIKQMIKTGAKMKDVIEEATSYQSAKMAELYMRYHDKPRSQTDKMHVIWIYGNSGSGKSYDSKKMFPNAYTKGNNMGKWYQDYDGESELILEEFRSHTMTFSELLSLLDPVEYRVETKGGSRQIRATTIIINSTYSPTEIYPNIEENRRQLYRRIHEIHFYADRDRRYIMKLDSNEDLKIKYKKIKMFCEKYQTKHDDSDDDNIEINLKDCVTVVGNTEKSKHKDKDNKTKTSKK